ncbi:MAG: SMP-30/gluconolactonase/LRE family protein [Phycisphaerales bacterium]|jgi:gluconolactonase|nr:SMP-30/gluconolactonase/LRE family protein [Phycisphaerales bacterium]
MADEIKQIATDLPGSEGPIFDRTGRFFVVSPNTGRIVRIDPQTGEKHEHANTGGIPAGLQVDRANNLWVADMKLGILSVSPNGQITDGVRTFENKPIRGCNDCAFDSNENLYFTAPAGSNAKTHVGEVYCRLNNGNVNLLDGGYAFSNGIAVDAGDRRLIVAETFTKSLWAYDLPSPGQVANRRLFAHLPGDDEGGPDGMDFDSRGNLLVAHWKGSSIDIFDPQGKLLERLMLPFTSPSNLHFGGADKRDLYITDLGNGSVWKTRWRHPG